MSYSDPFPPDCTKCGGYIPGNPNAYMGTWCRCNPEPPAPKEGDLREFAKFVASLCGEEPPTEPKEETTEKPNS